MDKITVLVGVLVVLIFVMAYIELSRGSLRGIKNKRTGNGQYGTARFMHNREIRRTFKKVGYEPSKWRLDKNSRLNLPQGTVLCLQRGFKKKYALVDTSDSNTLLVGPSGIGKTFFFLIPQIEYAAACGMSFVITDTKGNAFRKMGDVLEKYYGYKVYLIDLRNPMRSECFNIIQMVNRYMDLSKKHKGTQDGLIYEAKAQKYAKIVSKSIIEGVGGKAGVSHGDSFWYDNAEGLLASAILIIAEFAEEGERHIISVFKMIQELSKNMSNDNSNQDLRTEFSKLIQLLPENHKAKWFAGATVEADIKIALNTFSTTLSRLTKFIDSELEQLLCFDSDLSAEEFTKNKTAVFFVLPEEDSTKHFLFSIFLMQFYRELLIIADETPEVKLESRVMFYEDELGTLPAVSGIDMIFSAARSRNILSIPIIQSLEQLSEKYGDKGAKVITDNCQNTLFSGFAPTSDTAKKFSEDMGTYTAQTGSVSTGKDRANVNIQMMPRALMTPDEIKKQPRGDFIVMKTGGNPLKSWIPVFTKWGIECTDTINKRARVMRIPKYISIEKLKENIVKHSRIEGGF